jgi:NAD(P)H-dependent FMN reductase
MANPRIAVIIGSTRAMRFGERPAKWIHEIAAARADMRVELLDLREYPMPFFDEPASNAWVPSKNEVARRWQKKVAEFDGYIFVTAEYNRGIPAVLKNALDYAYPEWNRKAAAYVGYGSVGAAKDIKDFSYLEEGSKTMLDELHWGASALMVARGAADEQPGREVR